jgi:N6-L-threonylcarbamoyladenine synthase
MKGKINILSIETSCDETAAAVIIDGKVKANIIASQAQKHKQFGGVVPEVAAREHANVIIPTIKLALKKAKLNLKDLNYIAVTQGPGLATSLMVGIDTAQALGRALDIPVLPVNHMEGHLYGNFVDKTIKFPAVALTVSGGHTMLVLMTGHGKFKIIGETLDDAAGEAFDKTAKMMGLPYPGGPVLSKLAETGNPTAFDFPRPMMKSDNLDFSFSGLKTSVLYTIQKQKRLTPKVKADLCASVQQAIVDVLIAKLEKAIVQYKPKSILLAGGVAANKPLRERFETLARSMKLQSSTPPFEYCTDNAAMIGVAAYWRIRSKKAKFKKSFSANPNLPLQ